MNFSKLLATWLFTATWAMAQSTLPDAATLNATVRISVQDTLKTSEQPKDVSNMRVKAFVDQAMQNILWPNARRDGWRVVIDIETNGGKNGWEMYAGKYTTPNIDYIPSEKNSVWFSYSRKFR